MSLIIVTPIHNEEANIGVLAEQIAESTLKPDLWIVVDDGSTDRGAEMIRAMEHPMETVVLRRDNAGGLIGGSAFTAWQFGVDFAIEQQPNFAYVMEA
ncbi:glycosyltransferase family 2 protein [Prescottella equi]